MSTLRPVALLLGPPGAGKSTQVRRTAQVLGWHAVDFGHLVRSAVRNQTPLGARVLAHREARAAGPHRPVRAWLPGPLCRDLLDEHLDSAPQRGGVLFEGYPRLLEQASYLEAVPWRVVVAILIRVSPAQRRLRLKERVLDRESGQVGRRDQAAPGSWIPRLEDAPASLAARLIDWERDTKPLLEHYRTHGLLIEVDGTGEEAEVTATLVTAIRGRL